MKLDQDDPSNKNSRDQAKQGGRLQGHDYSSSGDVSSKDSADGVRGQPKKCPGDQSLAANGRDCVCADGNVPVRGRCPLKQEKPQAKGKQGHSEPVNSIERADRPTHQPACLLTHGLPRGRVPAKIRGTYTLRNPHTRLIYASSRIVALIAPWVACICRPSHVAGRCNAPKRSCSFGIGECQDPGTCDPETGKCSTPTNKDDRTRCSKGICIRGACIGKPYMGLCLDESS
jgi:hypothetical protein